MSLKISMDDFEKMVNKETRKTFGVDASNLPNIYWEDFWEEELTPKEAKIAVENFISSALELLSN